MRIRFIHKVHKVNEGYFNTPEEAKKAMERKSMLSNADVVAHTSDEILKRNIEDLLEREYNDNVEENNEILSKSQSAWYYWEATPLYLVLNYLSKLFDSLAWNVSEDMSLRFKVAFSGDDILFDVYTILEEEGLKTLDVVTKKSRNRDRYKQNGWLDGNVLIVPFRGNFLNDVVEELIYGNKNYFGSTLRMIAENSLKKCQKHSVEESVWNLILSKDPENLVLNSVHFFGNVQCDLLGSDMRPAVGMYRMNNEEKKKAIERLRGKIVIENKGTFRVALFDDDEIYDVK